MGAGAWHGLGQEGIPSHRQKYTSPPCPSLRPFPTKHLLLLARWSTLPHQPLPEAPIWSPGALLTLLLLEPSRLDTVSPVSPAPSWTPLLPRLFLRLCFVLLTVQPRTTPNSPFICSAEPRAAATAQLRRGRLCTGISWQMGEPGFPQKNLDVWHPPLPATWGAEPPPGPDHPGPHPLGALPAVIPPSLRLLPSSTCSLGVIPSSKTFGESDLYCLYLPASPATHSSAHCSLASAPTVPPKPLPDATVA